jgi:hypothetical protein
MCHRSRAILSLAFWATLSPGALAQENGILEGAGAVYADPFKTSLMESTSLVGNYRLWPESDGTTTSVSAGYSWKRHNFHDTTPIYNVTHEKTATLTEHYYNLGLDQGVGVGRIVGASLGRSDSPMGQGRWASLRVSEWWLKETLQTALEARWNETKQPIMSTQNFIGQTVITPEELHGKNLSLTVTNMTTPETITRGRVSLTERSDRPLAWSATGEVRQYITMTRSAAHLSYTHYDNTGTVRRVSAYGEVTANTFKGEWHQRVAEQAILMGGYRWSKEVDDYSALGLPAITTGSDTLYGSLRWRFNSDLWTDDAPEAQLFGTWYRFNDDQLNLKARYATTYGAGIRWGW